MRAGPSEGLAPWPTGLFQNKSQPRGGHRGRREMLICTQRQAHKRPSIHLLLAARGAAISEQEITQLL